MLKEFKAFITRGNVVDLGVGLVIGSAFTAIVTGFTEGLLNPIVALFGDSPLQDLKWDLNYNPVTDKATATFGYGLLLDAALRFLIIAAVLFFGVVRPINKLEERRKAGQPPEQPQTRQCPECLSDIPMKAVRCSQCTAKVGAAG